MSLIKDFDLGPIGIPEDELDALLHEGLAITPDGLPRWLTAAKFWSRSKFKGTAALKRKINPTRVPIKQKERMRWLDNLRSLSTELTGSPERCVHVGDREPASRYMQVEAFAQIDHEETDPILSITPQAA